MLKLQTPTTMQGGAAARNTWGRTCDTCRSAASSVYCRADLAYLCSSCDARIHSSAADHQPLHERVWVCESCERAPAAFLCKADSASLCAACDADIHSANPLARRHHRVPIQPIPHGPLAANIPSGLMVRPSGNGEEEFLTPEAVDDDDDDEAASWLLLNPMKNGEEEARAAALFGGEVDEYLDLDDYNQFSEGYNSQQQHYGVPQSSHGGDSVVPMQFQKGKSHCFQLGLEVGFSYPSSISQTVSMSSMEVGVVPESAASEVSNLISHTRPPKGTIDLFSSPPIQIPSQLTPMDREARVLRYREKKKTRKFEKTIRYASRKAYAETRPRIKGRFAKRRGADVEVDQLFADTAYGVVPSF